MATLKETYQTSNLYSVDAGEDESIRINGVDMKGFGFMLASYPNIFIRNVKQVAKDNRVNIGMGYHGENYENFDFDITGIISGINPENLALRIDELKQWLDFQRYQQCPNNRGGRGLALRIEVIGRNWYEIGGVSGVNGNKFVFGTFKNGFSTEWDMFLEPRSVIRFSNQSTVYTITNVVSSNKLELSPSLGISVGASNTYQAEQRRYVLVYLSGATLSPISNKGYMSSGRIAGENVRNESGASTFNLSLKFRTEYPFLFGKCTKFKQESVTSGTFYSIPNAGNISSSPTYILKGSLTDPHIVACDSSITSNFNSNSKFADIFNNEIALTISGDEKYRVSKINEGIEIIDDSISGSSVGNNEFFGFVVRFVPNESASAISSDVYYFDFYDDATADNAVRLFFDESDDDFVLEVRSGGTSDTTIRTTNSQRFDASNEMEVSVWFNKDGRVDEKDGIKYYGKVLVNGEISGSVTTPITNPATLLKEFMVGSKMSSFGPPAIGSNFCNAIVTGFQFFAYDPSDEELANLYHKKLLLSGNGSWKVNVSMDTGDILTMNESKVELYDSSAETKSNLTKLGTTSGTIDESNKGFPSFVPKNQKQVIYVNSVVPELNVIYEPLF